MTDTLTPTDEQIAYETPLDDHLTERVFEARREL